MSRRGALVALLVLAAGYAHAGLDRHTINQAGFKLVPGTALPAAAAVTDGTTPTTLAAVLAGKPALLVFEDYKCRSLCGVILDQLAQTLPEVPLRLGADYNVIAVALDDAQTPADAAAFSEQHTGGSTLATGAHFLTEDASARTAIEASVGLTAPFDSEHRQFAHPAGLVLVDASGHARQILNPFALNPFDLRLALTDGGGSISLVGHLQLLCYGWNPAAGVYTLRVERVLSIAAALTIMMIAGTVGALLWRTDRLRRSSGEARL